MAKVLSLVFTENFFSGGVLANGEGASATIELLEVDGFQLLPLFFEVKNDSVVYLIDREDFAISQGRRTVFGDYFQNIDGNTTFSLFGAHYALVTIITHALDRLKEKYRQANGNSPAEQAITTILTLPTTASSRAKDRLKDFLGKRGFKIVQEVSLAQAIKLNYSGLSKIGVLDSLGKNHIEFEVLSENDQYNEKIYEFEEEKSREAIVKLVFDRALQRSYSNLLNDEAAKTAEYHKYKYTANEWLQNLKKKPELDIHFTFPDGYASTTTLTKEQADELLLDSTAILNKIRTLQDKVKAGSPMQRLFLLGEKMNNTALLTSLQQLLGADKIFALTNDSKAIQEISAGILITYQKQFQDDAAMQLQKLITNINDKQKEISEPNKAEIIKIAAQAGIEEKQVNEWITKETQKLKVIKLLGLEQVTQLEEVQHPEYGKVVRKIMKEQYSSDKYERTKFYNECKTLVQLSHQHIAKVLFISEENEQKMYYLAQFMEGKMLASALPIANQATIHRYALQLLDALQYLHARNIWYKTLKPKNIIINTNADEFRLVASGLELTDNIHQRQRQNIKDVGLILLEMFTGKTAYQSVANVHDERWANIIKKTSTGSSGEPYKEISEIIKDINEMGKPKKGTSNFNFPIKKALAWFIVFFILFLGYIFFKDKVLNFINARVSNRDILQGNIPDVSDLPNIQGRFTGKLRLPSKKKADFWLTIKSLKPMQGNKAVFVYAIRIDSLSGENRYLNEREQVGELIVNEKQLKLQSKLFPDWEYDQDSQGKVSLKSMNAELKLE